MNAALLIRHFDRISNAPDAPSRLRRFVLDLAVRGKLVEQDFEDEPASELLERIQLEKAGLIKQGKAVKLQTSGNSDLASPPYEIPHNWKWVTLAETINTHLGGGTPSKSVPSYWNGDIRWASVKDVGKSKYVEETIDRITESGLLNSSSNLISAGNLIVVTRMGLGKVSINRVPIAINQDLRALYLSSLTEIDYHYIFFKTHEFNGTGLTVKGIKVEELLATNFPLPPLAEQRRIVAKVTELMVLCDRLEAAHHEVKERRSRLTAVSFHRLSNGANTEGLHEHTRFCLDNLTSLLSQPEQISVLRETIRNLAVQGRLVSLKGEYAPLDLLKAIKNERLQQNSTGSDLAKTAKEFATLEQQFQAAAPMTTPYITMRCACHFITKGTTPATEKLAPTGEIPFLKVYNIVKNSLDFNYKPTFIARSVHESELRRSRVYPGDVLMNIVGPPLGKVAVVTNQYPEWNVNQAIAIFRPLSAFATRFVMLVLASPMTIAGVLKETRGVVGQDNLSLEQVRSLRIPLLPISQQLRIVAKVDELMGLCDQLETQVSTAQVQAVRLLESILHHALSDNQFDKRQAEQLLQPCNA